MKGILKGLFSLFISIIWIVSFCSAEKVEDLITVVSSWTFNLYNTSSSFKSYTLYDIWTNYWTYCIKFTDFARDTSVSSASHFSLWFSSSFASRPTNNYFYYFDQVWNTVCLYWNKRYFLIWNVASSNNCYVNSALSFTWSYIFYKLNTLLNTDIPQYTSSECQQEYNLIPIENVDQNYCESNNLCSTCNYSWYENSLNVCTNNLNTCQSNLSSCLAWNYSWLNWSSLYINNIQHLWWPSIYLDIPEEINRDYQYSSNDDMFIDIEGYNVNYDSISGAIAIQNYKPDSSDLNKIITELIPLFIPWLVIILFLYFVFRFIKKIF